MIIIKTIYTYIFNSRKRVLSILLRKHLESVSINSSRCLSRPEKGHLTSIIFSNDTTPSGDPPMLPDECNHEPDGETICL